MQKHPQAPLMVCHNGGKVHPADEEREWIDGWQLIAEACEKALTGLHPQHPRRPDLLALTQDARLAAGLPGELRLRSA